MFKDDNGNLAMSEECMHLLFKDMTRKTSTDYEGKIQAKRFYAYEKDIAKKLPPTIRQHMKYNLERTAPKNGAATKIDGYKNVMGHPPLKFTVEPDLKKSIQAKTSYSGFHKDGQKKGEQEIKAELQQRINYNELLFMLTDKKNPSYTQKEIIQN